MNQRTSRILGLGILGLAMVATMQFMPVLQSPKGLPTLYAKTVSGNPMNDHPLIQASQTQPTTNARSVNISGSCNSRPIRSQNSTGITPHTIVPAKPVQPRGKTAPVRSDTIRVYNAKPLEPFRVKSNALLTRGNKLIEYGTRWLPGYRPGTPEAREVFQQWQKTKETPVVEKHVTGPTPSYPVLNPLEIRQLEENIYRDPRDPKSTWYDEPRNWRQIPYDDQGRPLLVPRPPELAVGPSIYLVPRESLEDPDVIRLPMGSFSIREDVPWGLTNWRSALEQYKQDHPDLFSFRLTPVNKNLMGYYIYKFKESAFVGHEESARNTLRSRYPSLLFAQYIGNYTYLIRTSLSDAHALQEDTATAWMEPYGLLYKIHPNVGRVSLPESFTRDTQFELAIHTFAGVNLDDLLNWIKLLGGQVIGINQVPWPYDQELWTYDVYFRLQRQDILTLAQFEGIHWIEEVAPRIPHNDVVPSANQSASFGNAAARPYWQAGVDGRTQMGADNACCNTNEGVELDNPSFANDCSTPASGSGTLNCTARKLVRCRGCTSDTAGWGHQSNTLANLGANASAYNATTNPGGISGSSGGCPRNNDSDLDTWPDFDATARGAKLTAIDLARVSDTEINYSTSVYNDTCTFNGNTTGARVHNRSYGYSTTGYDTNAQDVDTFSFNNRDYLAFTAAGNNDGTPAPCDETINVSPPATAKNDVTVGASGGLNANYYTYGFSDGSCSNLGPETTASGRVGPTIVNVSASNNNVGSYLSSSYCENQDGDMTAPIECTVISEGAQGTSFGSPYSASLALLVRDYFQQGFYPTGSANPSNAFSATAALAKAVLIAATDIMTGNQQGQADRWRTGATQVWGYGVPTLTNVLTINGDSRTPVGMKVYDAQCVASGTPWQQVLNVVKTTSSPLRIALVWTDGPGDNLINNLNLQVVHNGRTYYGNNFTGAYSNTSATLDTQNPTELVVIDPANVATGTLTITVTAATIGADDPACAGGNNQQFAVFVAGDVPNNSSISFNKNPYTCADSLTVTVTDVTAIDAATVSSAVTLTTSNGDSETIPAANWTGSSCTGSTCNKWMATIPVNNNSVATNNGSLNVIHGATITGTYTDPHLGHSNQQTQASVDCQPSVLDGGYLIDGGCDEGTAPEKYVPYMDAGELVTYTLGVYNNSLTDLNDVYVQLSLSGPGAGNVTILSANPVYIGRIPAQTVTGAAFNLQIAGATPALQSVTLTGSVTSPADGLTTAKDIVQAQLLETDDNIIERRNCRIHNSADMVGTNWTAYGFPSLSWTLSTSPTCSAENRTDGDCDNATISMYKQTTCGGANVPANGTGTLFPTAPIPTVSTGTAPNGQPWRYALKRHSFYGATANEGNTSMCWGVFYDDTYYSSAAPSDGSEVLDYPWALAWYYQTIFDCTAPSCGGTTWDWETANNGTPDATSDPFCGIVGTPPPNQLVICFPQVEAGNSTTSSRINYGQVAIDCQLLIGGSSPNNDGFGIDNDLIVWEEFYADSDGTNCTVTGQCGVVSFDKYRYSTYPNDTATITVLDNNATSPLTLTVTSDGTGDSETVTLTGTAPTFTGTLTLSHNSGDGPGNGILYVLPDDIIRTTYNDASGPGGGPCSDDDWAYVSAPGGNVIYVSNSVSTDNGDADAYADQNERVELLITIQNNMTTDLTNATVRISENDPDIDCLFKDIASYGTVAGGGTQKTNSATDPFVFHVSATASCTPPNGWQNPPKVPFTVYIEGDKFAGSSSPQRFTLDLDLDPAPPGSTWTMNEDFNTDPGWTVAVGPGDDDGVCTTTTYVNDFHWCSVCGNASGGYGAWQGDVAFSSGTYRVFSDSTLYTPILTAGLANPSLSFDRAYGTETNYDGAAVQYSINGGPWTYMNLSGMVNFNPNTAYCNPLDSSTSTPVWSNSTPQTWTNVSGTVPAASGDTFQVRWRLGSDSTFNYAGFGVDNVQITNLAQTVQCDTNDNSALPGCLAPGTAAPSAGSLRASKGSGNTIQVGFQNACYAWGHGIYYSKQPFPIDSADWTSAGCNFMDPDNNPLTMDVSFTPNVTLNTGELLWFVVVGNSAIGEGTYGTSSSGAQRPAATSAQDCRTQVLMGNCTP